MMNPVVPLILLAGFVTAEIPCRLYDVTTLNGDLGFEVHSRTNAVGLKTNFAAVTGLKDPLQDSKVTCVFNETEVCPGWELNGFAPSQWRREDPFVDWREIRPDTETVTEEVYDGKDWVIKRMFRYSGSDYMALKVHSGKFFIGSGHEFPVHGLELTLNALNRSDVYYQEINYRKSYENQQTNFVSGTVTLAQPTQDFIIVHLLRKDDNWCFWIDNQDDSSECLLTAPLQSSRGFSLITNPYNGAISVQYARGAMQLVDTTGTASITLFETRVDFCISLRYYLKNGETVNVTFIADDASRKIIRAGTLEGTGKIVSTQFSMAIPEPLMLRRLQITFGTVSGTTFLLRSARKCSAADRDVIIDESAEFNLDISTHNHDDKRLSIRKGFSISCPDYRNTDTTGLNKECHHGGLKVDGWCKCLPGFTGPSCEKACPPGRFGGDCDGICVNSPDCKGIFMAAPGEDLECARGFTGPKCDQSCSEGFYGPNCRLRCGECLLGTCDRFSGLCNGPCKRGYENRTCQYELSSVKEIKILSTTFHSAKGLVDVTNLSDEEWRSYPFIKILYKKKISETWSTKFLPLTSREVDFQLDNLEYDQWYAVNAILIHKSGNFKEESGLMQTFSTNCMVGTFDRVDFVSEATKLNVSWKMTDSETYPCKTTGYVLEVLLPEREVPIYKWIPPFETHATIESQFPRYGYFRLGANYSTKPTEWTYHQFSNKIDKILRTIDILGETARSIDFTWSSSDGLSEDVVVCEPEPVLCIDRELDNKTQKVRKGEFTMNGLFPFTTYKCSLELSQIQASTITQQDLPSGSPKQHNQPPHVTNTTVFIQWENADCLDINGIPIGFRIELWRGNSSEGLNTTTDTTFTAFFDDLLPETSYEARIYVINQLGWNVAHFLSIPFKTKSTSPNAVTDLLVYKRTRNDLWLRWIAPESDSTETVVVAYKVTASAPGVETKTSETTPVQCLIWPEYLCHRVRSLVPDMEYTIEVQAKNNKVDLFGPSTVAKAITKEGVPDPPVDVRIQNRTSNSVLLTWKIPVVLNSNPKYFFVTLEQTDENDSQEKPTDSLEKKVPITEGKQIYEAVFDQLNSATTYVVTISAGLRGQRSIVSVNTPPKSPPAPPAPTVDTTVGSKRVVFHGIPNQNHSHNLLSGYLLLAATNNTVGHNHEITDDSIAASIQAHFSDDFFVAHEFAPTLTDEVFNFESEPAVPGNFSLIQNTRLESGQEYCFALAAISTYCDAHAVSISPVLTFKN